MILTCPSCDTQYYADESSLGETDRQVKCAACGHNWHVAGRRNEPSSESIGGAHEAFRARIREQRVRARRRAVLVAWGTTSAVFVALLTAAVMFRNDVARAWPQAAALYEIAGLDVNRFGLEFVSHSATRSFDGTVPILGVEGKVVNSTDQTRDVADVRVELHDEFGQPVDEFFALVTPRRLAPGEQGVFNATLRRPPNEAFELVLSFADHVPGRTSPRQAPQVQADAEPAAAADGLE